MKLTIEGMPEELAAFLGGRGVATAPVLIEPVRPDPVTHEPNTDAPPAQTIAPSAIEKLEFGVDSAGAPVDVAAVHRRIGELLRSRSFQEHAALHVPLLDAFEPPMMRAKRFLHGTCVRDNLFDLGKLEALCAMHLVPQQAMTPQPPSTGGIVTFEGRME